MAIFAFVDGENKAKFVLDCMVEETETIEGL